MPRTVVFIDVNLFVLDASLEAFYEDIVESPSLPVHADFDLLGKKALQIAVTGKMASQVAVEDGGRSG